MNNNKKVDNPVPQLNEELLEEMIDYVEFCIGSSYRDTNEDDEKFLEKLIQVQKGITTDKEQLNNF